MKPPRRLAAWASVSVVVGVLAGCSATTPSLGPSTAPTSASPSALAEACRPAPSASPCDPSQITLAPGGWGGAGGTMFAVIHVQLASGPSCLVPAYPAVELVDATGHLIASGPSTDASAVLVSDGIDLRLGWTSWCAAPPPGPLQVRLQIGSGQPELTLPAGLVAAPCQGVATSVDVEPVTPIGM